MKQPMLGDKINNGYLESVAMDLKAILYQRSHINLHHIDNFQRVFRLLQNFIIKKKKIKLYVLSNLKLNPLK